MSHPQTDINPERIFQVGLGFWASKTLLSAIELGLFTHLAKGPMPLPALESELQLHSRGSRDFLDALVALGFLNREGDNYSNSPETNLFLDRSKPSYIGGIFEMANTRLYRYWGDLTTALHTGQPQNEIKDGLENPFTELYSSPERLRNFLAAMTGISLGAARVIAAKFPWDRYKTFVDIGCAQGGLATQVCLAHPHLSGVGYDLAVVGPVFEDYVRSFELANRLKFQAGNFFTETLPSSDVIVMGHILHDWNLEQKKDLIRKVYAALNPGGAFLIYEAIIDDDRRKNAFGLMMSLNMLVETPGGFDYTGADCQSWLREAGFRDTRVEPLAGPDSMVIGIKP
jgi:SAM-dependent methyltransferase